MTHPAKTTERRLEELLSGMTLRQKIGQLTQYNAALFTRTAAQITGPMEKLGLRPEDLAAVGSVLNFSSATEMRAIQDAHLKNDPNAIPMLFMLDVIHGYRTIYPIPLGLSCSFDPALAAVCARMAAAEASASGVHVTFAPMVDYVRDPRWGRVMESGGEEPRLTAAMAQAQIRGFHGSDLKDCGSLATCVKHYAGYGGAEAGRDYNLAECSPRELREYYLPAYKACIDAGAPLIMPSFNSLNGIPSIANPLLRRILREEWRFDGAVIADYNAVGELVKHGVAADLREAARLAFGNGCDIEMCSGAYFGHLEQLIREGVFTGQQLDAAVMRVLRLKERMGLFDDPYHGADEETAQRLYLCPAHRRIARQAAEESAVLLKNSGVLPFSGSAVNRVALIGPFAHEHGINGFWSCQGRDEDTVTVLEGVQQLLGAHRTAYARGCGCAWDDGDRSGFREAVELAKASDAVILCLGEPQTYSGEGNCRTDLRLPGVQVELARQVAAANPNTAVVLFNGRPLALSDLDAFAPAILEMWFPGTEGGHAAAALLFGRANPCGKLCMTFPRSVGQCPIYYNHPATGRPHWTSDAEHRGYASDYIDCATLPLYSFGHGLSYARFDYLSLAVSSPTLEKGGSLEVSVTVRNDSDRAGKEVVQLYMRDVVASVVRPVQQLIAFEKVAFAPGETKTVTFTVSEEMLRFWNFEEQYVSEPGEIVLMTSYADHLLLHKSIELL